MSAVKAEKDVPLKQVPDGRGVKWIYAFCRFIVRALIPLVAKLRTEGTETIPRTGPVIMVSNHVAWLDVPLVAAPVRRQVHMMAKIELFRIPVLGTLMRWFGAFAVRRGEGDRESLRVAERVLADGELLFIFPEGHRSGTGVLGRAHPGAALIALRANVPIVPVAITGTQNGLHGFRYGPFAPHVRIRYGKPFMLPATEGRRSRDALAQTTRRLMEEIAVLLPPEYRGQWDPDKAVTAPAVPPAEIEAATEVAQEPSAQ